MLGGGDGVGRRRIHHQASKLSRRPQIHVVDADAGPTDDLQPAARRLEHLAADLGPAPHDQRVAKRDLGAELFGAEVVGAVDIGEFLEEVEPGLAELLGDQNGGLGVEPSSGEHHHEPRRGPAARGERAGENGGQSRLGGKREGGVSEKWGA